VAVGGARLWLPIVLRSPHLDMSNCRFTLTTAYETSKISEMPLESLDRLSSILALSMYDYKGLVASRRHKLFRRPNAETPTFKKVRSRLSAQYLQHDSRAIRAA